MTRLSDLPGFRSAFKTIDRRELGLHVLRNEISDALETSYDPEETRQFDLANLLTKYGRVEASPETFEQFALSGYSILDIGVARLVAEKINSKNHDLKLEARDLLMLPLYHEAVHGLIQDYKAGIESQHTETQTEPATHPAIRSGERVHPILLSLDPDSHELNFDPYSYEQQPTHREDKVDKKREYGLRDREERRKHLTENHRRMNTHQPRRKHRERDRCREDVLTAHTLQGLALNVDQDTLDVAMEVQSYFQRHYHELGEIAKNELRVGLDYSDREEVPITTIGLVLYDAYKATVEAVMEKPGFIGVLDKVSTSFVEGSAFDLCAENKYDSLRVNELAFLFFLGETPSTKWRVA